MRSFWNRIRAFLFGRDDAVYFEVREYCRYVMADRTMADRFCYNVVCPPLWAIWNWQQGWDHRFRMRYQDRWRARR